MMNEEERYQVRAAAESLLGGSLQSQRSISSINREYLFNESLIAGARINGRMSSVRRFFCLLVTFDLLLTCLMWLICTAITGENVTNALVDEILHYQIEKSLIDVVLIAACRFLILILCYGLLHMNHRIIIALSTAETCAFIGVKAYYLNWPDISQPGFVALLILTSFILAWSEAWYFDCRVVPEEIQAREWLNSPTITNNERAPLLRNAHNTPVRVSENIGNFFTPMDSPTHSDDESIPETACVTTTDDDFTKLIQAVPSLSENKIDEYKAKAKLLVNQSYELLTSNQWKKLNSTPAGDVISVLSSHYGKILKIEGLVDAPANELVDQMYDNVEDIPKWNDDVSLVKKIEVINSNTDIIYQSTRAYGGGLIGPRDFITLRHRNKCGKYYMSSGISVHINLPHRKNHTRAENGIVCFATEKIEDMGDSENLNKCHVTMVLHANLNGWLPQQVIDKSLASVLEKMMNSIRRYIDQLPDISG